MPKAKTSKSKKRTTPRKLAMGAKAAFVRKFPLDTPISVVRAAAKAAGINMSDGTIYAARTAKALKDPKRDPEDKGHTTVRLKRLIMLVGPATAARVLGQVLSAA